MKSIKQQYIDLKEGKMSQNNFMRNLRMTMPQYVTSITSFGDAVKILKNKGILNEAYMNTDVEEEIVDEMNMEVQPEESNDDAEFDAILKQLEDEIAGEIAVKSDVLDEPLEEVEGATADTVAIEKAIKDKKIDPAVVKTAAEKAMRGDSTDLALLMVNAGGLSEGKGKDLHPNLIHPGELRMGIRVEMEHTDDIDKAKKIALDHLAENPYYYTALKLSGIESPTKPKEKAKKEVKSRKKKDTIELIDKANQMQKVKMPKTVKEAMEVDPQGQLKQQLPSSSDTERLLKFLKNNTTFVSMLKNIDNVTELAQFWRELLQLTDPELQSLSDTQLQSIFRKAVLDFRKETGVPNQIFSKNANIQKGINNIGGIKEAETPTEDKIEMELASALSQQPTLKRILQKVDLPTEVDGTVKALLDRTNLKNIPDQIILAALRKVLNDQPGPTFTAQYAANATIGKPNPGLGKTLEEKLRLMVREVLAEESSSKKNAASEITAKAVDYIDDYNEGEKTYKKSQLENVFDSYEDKVGRRFDDSVFEDVIDMLKAKGYTMAMKETFDGRDNLTNIIDDTQE
jgi:hypothetical protein